MDAGKLDDELAPRKPDQPDIASVNVLLHLEVQAWLKRRGKYIPAKLSHQQRLEFKECFNLMDEDGSGAIDAVELRAAFKMLGIQMTLKAVESVVGEVDDGGTGEVEYEEFVNIMTNVLAKMTREAEESGTNMGTSLPFSLMSTAYKRKRALSSIMSGNKDVLQQIAKMEERRKREQVRAERLLLEEQGTTEVADLVANARSPPRRAGSPSKRSGSPAKSTCRSAHSRGMFSPKRTTNQQKAVVRPPPLTNPLEGFSPNELMAVHSVSLMEDRGRKSVLQSQNPQGSFACGYRLAAHSIDRPHASCEPVLEGGGALSRSPSRRQPATAPGTSPSRSRVFKAQCLLVSPFPPSSVGMGLGSAHSPIFSLGPPALNPSQSAVWNGVPLLSSRRSGLERTPSILSSPSSTWSLPRTFHQDPLLQLPSSGLDLKFSRSVVQLPNALRGTFVRSGPHAVFSSPCLVPSPVDLPINGVDGDSGWASSCEDELCSPPMSGPTTPVGSHSGAADAGYTLLTPKPGLAGHCSRASAQPIMECGPLGGVEDGAHARASRVCAATRWDIHIQVPPLSLSGGASPTESPFVEVIPNVRSRTKAYADRLRSETTDLFLTKVGVALPADKGGPGSPGQGGGLRSPGWHGPTGSKGGLPRTNRLLPAVQPAVLPQYLCVFGGKDVTAGAEDEEGGGKLEESASASCPLPSNLPVLKCRKQASQARSWNLSPQEGTTNGADPHRASALHGSRKDGDPPLVVGSKLKLRVGGVGGVGC